LTVYYRLSGTAINGVDYTTNSGVVTVPGNPGYADVIIHPIQDDLIEFDEPVTLTILQTNTYLIQPGFSSATIFVRDNFPTNIFLPVVTNLNDPSGLDYHAPSNSLIVGLAGFPDPTNNFLSVDSNGVVAGWTGIAELAEEVKLATVKKTQNGFTNGDIYFNGQSSGEVGRISWTGTNWNTNWVTLTGEPFRVQSGFYVDQTGVFSNSLIAVSGVSPSEGANVWQVDAAGNATNLVSLPSLHCEGVITLTNDVPRWGPWAGKILTGAESEFDGTTNLFAIDTNGAVARFDLGISAESFNLIQTNQDLYLLDESEDGGQIPGQVLKLSHTLLKDYVGDLLITQGGRYAPPPELFIVHWDGARFVLRRIPVRYYSKETHLPDELESSTFAPINLPPLSP
jgi:hypothetical protein